MRTPLVPALLLLAFTPTAAQAQLDCTVPTRERVSSLPGPTSRELAPFRRLVLSAEAIVKRNQTFVAGSRPVRIRTTIDYADASVQPRAAIINTVAYNEGAWVEGRCALVPDADRAAGVSDGGIQLVINDPRSFLTGREDDGVLESFAEPVRTGQVAGFPEFNGKYVLVSAGNRVPWVPVTIADELDREMRRIGRLQAAWEEEKARPWLTEAKIERTYAAMKRIDRDAAETNREALLAVMEAEQARRPSIEAEHDARLARQLDDLRTYRASFSRAQLAEPARVDVFPDGTIRVDDPDGRVRVKVDPAIATLDPDRVHFIRVSAGGVPDDPTPGRSAWMQRSKAAIDFEALRALIE